MAAACSGRQWKWRWHVATTRACAQCRAAMHKHTRCRALQACGAHATLPSHTRRPLHSPSTNLGSATPACPGQSTPSEHRKTPPSPPSWRTSPAEGGAGSSVSSARGAAGRCVYAGPWPLARVWGVAMVTTLGEPLWSWVGATFAPVCDQRGSPNWQPWQAHPRTCHLLPGPAGRLRPPATARGCTHLQAAHHGQVHPELGQHHLHGHLPGAMSDCRGRAGGRRVDCV